MKAAILTPGLVLILGACPGPIYCEVASESDVLEQLGPNSNCREVIVYESEFTDLRVLEDVDLSDALVRIDRNERLTSTEGLGSVRELTVTNNNPLLNLIRVERVGIEALLERGSDVQVGVPSERAAEVEPAAELGGVVDVRLLWNDEPASRRLEVFCADGDTCRFNLSIGPEQGRLDHEVILGEGAQVRSLLVRGTEVPLAFLQQLGVPDTRVSFLESVSATDVAAYRDWLATQGFDGEFCDAGICD